MQPETGFHFWLKQLMLIQAPGQGRDGKSATQSSWLIKKKKKREEEKKKKTSDQHRHWGAWGKVTCVGVSYARHFLQSAI